MSGDTASSGRGTRAGEARAGAGESRLHAVDELLDPYTVFEAVRDGSGTIVDFLYAEANAAACAYNGLSRRDLIGSRLLQRLPGIRESGLFASYCRVVETCESLALDGVTYESSLTGVGPLYYDLRAVKEGDGLSVWWRDVTDRHLASWALQEQRDLAVALGAAGDLAEALGLVMEAALELPGVDSGGVYLVDPRTAELALTVHAGLSPGFAAQVSRFPPEARQTRLLMAGASRFLDGDGLLRELGTTSEAIDGIRALAVVPIRHEGVVVAAFNLASHTRDGFTRQESTLIETLAAVVGGAIVRLRVEAELRDEVARLRTQVTAGDADPGAAEGGAPDGGRA